MCSICGLFCIFVVTKKRNTMSTKLQEFIQSIAFDSERFLPINNFEGRFWVSDHGRIISFNHKFKLLKPGISYGGYRSLRLRHKPKDLNIRLHSVVGEHFCEMIHRGVRMTWNHKDGNKLNNHYTNLEYITARENCLHALENGLMAKGEKHGQSKLTDQQVRDIYALKNSEINYTQTAKRFNICRSQVTDIIKGKAWQHITSGLI